jgi:DNA binding domain, excisionase family
MPHRVLTVAAVASRWGTSTTFVYTLLQSGALEGFKLGGKLWRIKGSAVEAYECRTRLAA